MISAIEYVGFEVLNGRVRLRVHFFFAIQKFENLKSGGDWWSSRSGVAFAKLTIWFMGFVENSFFFIGGRYKSIYERDYMFFGLW